MVHILCSYKNAFFQICDQYFKILPDATPPLHFIFRLTLTAHWTWSHGGHLAMWEFFGCGMRWWRWLSLPKISEKNDAKAAGNPKKTKMMGTGKVRILGVAGIWGAINRCVINVSPPMSSLAQLMSRQTLINGNEDVHARSTISLQNHRWDAELVRGQRWGSAKAELRLLDESAAHLDERGGTYRILYTSQKSFLFWRKNEIFCQINKQWHFSFTVIVPRNSCFSDYFPNPFKCFSFFGEENALSINF